MKPPSFEYYVPESVEEALDYLAQYGDEAKPLAGGQSLIPTMNFRLAQPAVLIDLNPLSELSYIRTESDETVRIGAMTRHRQVEFDAQVEQVVPLLRETMPYIAHLQIRNRGTIGGSLAHADPSAELPAVTTALEARFRIRGPAGERWISADDFFVDIFTTALKSDELLTEVAFPSLPPRSGWSMKEMSRRHGDYALVGVTAVVTLDEMNRCQQARLVFLSVGYRPVIAYQAMHLLHEEEPTPELIQAAAEMAAQTDIDPTQDIHASAEFRRYLAKNLAVQALTEAFQRAKPH